MKRKRLERLTNRWRERHDARRSIDRPLADAAIEAVAARAFPFGSVEPAEYVADHGADMIGFICDEERYVDPQLDAWLVEVGRLLRSRR